METGRQGRQLGLEGLSLSNRWTLSHPHCHKPTHSLKMGNVVAALVELEEASKILPENPKLKLDADNLREAINNGGADVLEE